MAKGHPPSIAYLLGIEYEAFPRTVKAPDEIEHVRKLTAAKYLEAEIPPPSTDRPTFGEQPPATILRLTRHGRVEVDRLKKLASRR